MPVGLSLKAQEPGSYREAGNRRQPEFADSPLPSVERGRTLWRVGVDVLHGHAQLASQRFDDVLMPR
jgi:hypothetical protein